MQPQYGAVKLRFLPAIVTKPGIIKLNLYVLEGSKQEPLLVLIYVNDLDNNAAML